MLGPVAAGGDRQDRRRDHDPDEQHGDGGADEQLDVQRRCGGRSWARRECSLGTESAGAESDDRERHQVARIRASSLAFGRCCDATASSSPSPAWTATIGAPRSSPGRCATPGSRSSTPACSRRRAGRRDRAAGGRRRGRPVAALGRAHDAVPPGGRSCSASAASTTSRVRRRASSPTPTSRSSRRRRRRGLHARRAADLDHRVARAGARRAGGPAGRLTHRSLTASVDAAGVIDSRSPWTCSSTRASSCSRGTASPCRPARRSTPSTTRSPRPTASATRSS